MITKIDETLYYITNKILRDAEIHFKNISNNKYALTLENGFLRKLKIDVVNEVKSDAVSWYESMMENKVDTCVKTSYDTLIIIKELHINGNQILFTGYLDGKVDFEKDILYSTSYSNFNFDYPIYKVEVDGMSVKYPKLLNLLLHENETDLGF
jgi:hypothetical protein